MQTIKTTNVNLGLYVFYWLNICPSESFQTNQSSKTRHPVFRHEWVGGWWVTPIASRRFPGGNCRCCSAAWEPATFPSTNCLPPPCLGPFWTRSKSICPSGQMFLYKSQKCIFSIGQMYVSECKFFVSKLWNVFVQLVKFICEKYQPHKLTVLAPFSSFWNGYTLAIIFPLKWCSSVQC